MITATGEFEQSGGKAVALLPQSKNFGVRPDASERCGLTRGRTSLAVLVGRRKSGARGAAVQKKAEVALGISDGLDSAWAQGYGLQQVRLYTVSYISVVAPSGDLIPSGFISKPKASSVFLGSSGSSVCQHTANGSPSGRVNGETTCAESSLRSIRTCPRSEIRFHSRRIPNEDEEFLDRGCRGFLGVLRD